MNIIYIYIYIHVICEDITRGEHISLLGYVCEVSVISVFSPPPIFVMVCCFYTYVTLCFFAVCHFLPYLPNFKPYLPTRCSWYRHSYYVDWLVGQPFSWLVCFLVGWLVGRSVDWLIHQPVVGSEFMTRRPSITRTARTRTTCGKRSRRGRRQQVSLHPQNRSHSEH